MQQDFWKEIKNHAELKRLLLKHSIIVDGSKFDAKVFEVAQCWMKLSRQHLKDAEAVSTGKHKRSFFSRNYYAGYSASKAIRYISKGSVSGRGDDHQSVSDLPDDFPNLEKWGDFLRQMYQYRLISDYDGWTVSSKDLKLDPKEALSKMKEFIKVCKSFVKDKYGVSL